MTTDTRDTEFKANARHPRGFVLYDEAPHPALQEEPLPPNLGFAALIVLAGVAVPLAAAVAAIILAIRIFW